jgi:hypothetical protein
VSSVWKEILSGVHDEATKNEALKNMLVHFEKLIGVIIFFLGRNERFSRRNVLI